MIGLGYDVAIFALLAAVLFMLYRLARARAWQGIELEEPGEEAVPAGRIARLGGYYQRLARQAGYHPPSLRWTFWISKFALALMLPLVCLELTARWQLRPPWWLVAVLLVLGFFLPDLWLRSTRKRRRRRIRAAMSYFVDLIVSLLHSGLGLEEAFRRAARLGLPLNHPMAHEAGLVDLELGAGKDRSLAFQALAERTGVREFNALAAALRLGMRLGNPVHETLGAQADLLRLKRREEARRAISLAPVKTLLPVLLCGFPIFLVLVIFPAIVEMAGVLEQIQALLRAL